MASHPNLPTPSYTFSYNLAAVHSYLLRIPSFLPSFSARACVTPTTERHLPPSQAKLKSCALFITWNETTAPPWLWQRSNSTLTTQIALVLSAGSLIKSNYKYTYDDDDDDDETNLPTNKPTYPPTQQNTHTIHTPNESAHTCESEERYHACSLRLRVGCESTTPLALVSLARAAAAVRRLASAVAASCRVL